MDVQEYIGRQLAGMKFALNNTLDTLTQQEVSWRPSSGCNSIGLILFHTARSEDWFMQGILQNKPLIWETEKWYEKLGLDEKEEGSHYTEDQVNAFQVPKLEKIMAYYDAVRDATKAYLRSMKPEDFDEKITFPNYGEMPRATVFSMLAIHTSEHIGEMAYLRGLQRGIDK